MTEEAQRIVIAEVCGWTVTVQANYISAKHPTRGAGGGPGNFSSAVLYMANVPDYLNDLNAMHEAEMTLRLSGPGSGIYRHELDQVCSRDNESAVFATAAQRAEAFLKTIGKWVESLESKQKP